MKNPFSYPNDTMKALSVLTSYFQAAEWTEDLKSEKIDIDSWNKAYNECYKFIQDFMISEHYKNSKFIMDWDSQNMVSQFGHDFWLTRNGHGSGFWDREEIWGDCADFLSELAKSSGERYASVENGSLFIE